MPLPPRPKLKVGRITTYPNVPAFILEKPFECNDSEVRAAIQEELQISPGGASTPPTAIIALANVKFGASSGSGITHVLPASPATGQKAQYLVTASGADRSLDLDSAIRLPSDSALSLPKNMTSGKTYIAQFEYFGSFWGLTTLVGGY